MGDQNNWFEQLEVMQSNIVSIFQGIIKERNDYKESKDTLAASLRQMVVRIDNLEKQNKMLQECCASMRNIFGVGVKTFKKLDLSCVNSIKDNRVSLEYLQKLFLESTEKTEVKTDVGNQVQFTSGGQQGNSQIDMARPQVIKGDRIKVEFEFNNSIVQTLAKNDTDRNERENQSELNENSHEEISVNTLLRKSAVVNAKRKLVNLMDASISEQVNAEISAVVHEPVSPPPVKKEHVNGSPVFKDARKQEENKTSRSTHLKLINEKFVEKSAQLLLSPLKLPQANGFSTSKGQFTPSRARNDYRINSPNRSPKTLLRKSNLRETDVTWSGGRKLTQTILNIDCFKSKSSLTAKSCKSEEDEKFNKRDGIVSAEDDDIIFESPKILKQSLENLQNEIITENENRGLDETFISSPALRQFNSGQNHVVEGIMGNQPSHKRPREKSPEYDSVPFVYKRETVRKREERMKLPGQPCVECNKYYENEFGDLNTDDLKKMLNRCSRHRDKNPPTLDDTPPGYWKPYLTCTIVCSPKKDDAQ